MTALFATGSGPVGAAVAPSVAGPACTDRFVPVPSLGQVHGTLCRPAGARTVLLLVPGATYNETYWDFPYRAQVYSFSKAMNRAGYATFTLDRLATGRSSRPPSALATTSADARAAHEVVTSLRTAGFSRVVIGGHSLGSAVAILEASTYQDVDAALLTGFSHTPNTEGFVKVYGSVYPATLDPKFAGRVTDPGYLTTRPGTRETAFYAPGTAERGVVATDEATKDIFSTNANPDASVTEVLPLTRLITVPTLLANGQRDASICPLTNCGTAEQLRQREQAFYGGRFSTYVLTGSGHVVNLEPNTQNYQRAVLAWLRTVGNQGVTG